MIYKDTNCYRHLPMAFAENRQACSRIPHSNQRHCEQTHLFHSMIDMCGLQLVLVLKVTILTSCSNCYHSSLYLKTNGFLHIHVVQELANLHCMNCITHSRLATLKTSCHLAQHIFLVKEDESVVFFMPLHRVRIQVGCK